MQKSELLFTLVSISITHYEYIRLIFFLPDQWLPSTLYKNLSSKYAKLSPKKYCFSGTETIYVPNLFGDFNEISKDGWALQHRIFWKSWVCPRYVEVTLDNGEDKIHQANLIMWAEEDFQKIFISRNSL